MNSFSSSNIYNVHHWYKNIEVTVASDFAWQKVHFCTCLSICKAYKNVNFIEILGSKKWLFQLGQTHFSLWNDSLGRMSLYMLVHGVYSFPYNLCVNINTEMWKNDKSHGIFFQHFSLLGVSPFPLKLKPVS